MDSLFQTLIVVVFAGGGLLFATMLQRSATRITLPVAMLALGPLAAAFGLYLIFVLAPQRDAEAAHAEALPYQMGTVSDLGAGSEVIVTGVLQPGDYPTDDNAEVTAMIRDLQLMAYVLETWNVELDSSYDVTRYYGTWEVVRRAMLPLTLNADGQLVRVNSADLNLEETPHSDVIRRRQEYTEPADDCEYDCESRPIFALARYGDQNLTEGSLRVRGYSAGDQLTVLGRLTERVVIQPTRIMGGTRENLLDAMRSSAGGTRTGGIVLLVVGAGMFLFGLGSTLPSAGRDAALSGDELAQRSR